MNKLHLKNYCKFPLGLDETEKKSGQETGKKRAQVPTTEARLECQHHQPHTVWHSYSRFTRVFKENILW